MNEGMAQMFEESIWVGKDFLTNQIPGKTGRRICSTICRKNWVAFSTG